MARNLQGVLQQAVGTPVHSSGSFFLFVAPRLCRRIPLSALPVMMRPTRPSSKAWVSFRTITAASLACPFGTESIACAMDCHIEQAEELRVPSWRGWGWGGSCPALIFHPCLSLISVA
eukprot:1158269-Pelagomonas_calceolata.AAC.23